MLNIRRWLRLAFLEGVEYSGEIYELIADRNELKESLGRRKTRGQAVVLGRARQQEKGKRLSKSHCIGTRIM